MQFTSFSFYFFLIAVLVLFHVLPWRAGRWVLVAASYVFYGAAEPWYCLLLLTSTLVDFFAAQGIHRATDTAVKKRYLWLSIVVNLSLLGIFKYADFAVANANAVLGLFGVPPVPELHLLLPVGISFYTFQTMSYTIDVYRGRSAPTRDFGAFALYVAFFPQLIAGPIERAHRLLPQFLQRPRIDLQDLGYGFQRILWGLVKKLVFADRLALMVDPVYASPALYSAPQLVVATMCFMFQLYLDFSAYTDIAIGTARMMGIRLSENFRWPLLARNPAEFWSRWHITLTTWFRDYVYRPLGGTRRGRPLAGFFSIVLVMTLIGLWHGADWSFVAFGLLAGLTLGGYHLLRLRRTRVRRGPLFGAHWWSTPLALLLMLIGINCGAVLFRAPDITIAAQVFGGMLFNGWRWDPVFNLQLGMLVVLYIAHAWRAYSNGHGLVAMPAPLRALFWTGMLLLLIYGAVDRSEQFIYFQF